MAVEQPVCAAHQCRIVAFQAGVGQRQDGEGGVPHGRLAGLQPHRITVLDGEAIEPGKPRADNRVLQRIALEVQRHQRVHPRGLDAAPAAVCLLALDHPPFGRGQGRAPQRPKRMALVDAHHAVEDIQHAPGERRRWGHRGGVGGTQLLQRERQLAGRPVGTDDHQRDDRLPGPTREVVGIEGEPAGKEHQLRRYRRYLVPGPEAEQRHPDVGENARLARAPVLSRPGGRPLHVWRRGFVAGHTQRPVGLDRRR